MTTEVKGITESQLMGKAGTPTLLCKPNIAGTFPCVMILHERYGMVPHTEDLARRLAADGFVVLAPNLFHAHPDQAGLREGKFFYWPTDDVVQAGCEDAFPLFSDVPEADPSRFGMIGICQTGRYPLVWASRRPIQAAIALYGAAVAVDWEYTDRHPDGIDKLLDKMTRRTSILGIFGEGDNVISIDDVQRFRTAIEQRNLSYQITIVPNVPHGWINDTMPGRYRPEAAKQTWDEMIAFLRKTLAAGATSDRVTWSFQSDKSVDYDFSKNTRHY